MSEVITLSSTASVNVPIYGPVLLAMLACLGWKTAEVIIEILAFIIAQLSRLLILGVVAVLTRWGW